MNQQDQYGVDIPYTDFSENILEPENEKKYGVTITRYGRLVKRRI